MRDGHIHSPYCPHGSGDAFEKYINKAISLGYKSMTFTEHAPLPAPFTDPVPEKDSAMQLRDLPSYIRDLRELKERYRRDIEIKIGLEVDFIEGFEGETKEFLDNWGKELDEAILSVHFLRLPDNRYICLDYSPDSFKLLTEKFSSLEAVYKKYYDTLLFSVEADLGPYKPKRIGHITLVRKFQKLFPRHFDDKNYLTPLLQALKKQGYSLDINGAGLIKPYCGELYPPEEWIRAAQKEGISLVYGSDAHDPQQLGQGIQELRKLPFFSENFNS
ncbi:histidinol-phosphatase HisJ [Evansella clarkii]|uniref:histidinol-phosphatase HisJ n=1 Tax=Evansella clarkii TaxID=79879 RepID=UPI000B450FA9|nr:histidinol-phosphatase HisJ [Evansella clarkii]